jgi:ADP-ribosyl-[dinitrogen reductase] hydrolase
VKLGGDTDTTGAILGGLAGASCGVQAIPLEWTDRLIEWPYSVTWLQNTLGKTLHRQFAESDGSVNLSGSVSPPLPRPFNGLMVLFRNVAFLIVVLMHGFRRLLPPY